MDSRELRPHVERLFRPEARGTRLGVEQELLVIDRATGSTVAPAAIEAAVAGHPHARHLGFEPGGQVELSLPCGPSATVVARRLGAAAAGLAQDLDRIGVTLAAVPVDPRLDAQVPLRLSSDRYLAMQRHFDTIGPAGRRMMRRTASTQVCLDWWPGAAGLEQWRVLQLAGPCLAAAFARSAGPRGRLATWLAVDPARTGFDDRLLHGSDPVAAYADFAAGASAFTGPDPATHLTTLFPPVRPRGHYLEVRFLDVQETGAVHRALTVLARLAYDDEHRRTWLRRLSPGAAAVGEQWARAAAGAPDLAALGREIAQARGRAAA